MKLNAEISRNLFLRVLGGLPGHCVCSVLVGTGHWLVLSQANGIIASTEGWSPSTRVVWPAPVASSTKHAPHRNETVYPPSRQSNFDGAGEGHNVLTTGCWMPIQKVSGRPLAKVNRRSGQRGGKLRVGRQVHLPNMTLAVAAGVETKDAHCQFPLD